MKQGTKLIRVGSAYDEYEVIEITGSGTQELIAGVSGMNIAIKNWEGVVGTACTVSLEYDSNPIAPKYNLANKGSFERKFTENVLVLPKGEGLDVVTNVDPNEGWIALEYDFVNYNTIDGEVY